MAEITVLGAYGGRGKSKSTTSVLLNKSVVIDAGNILYPLDDAAINIDHIFLTHCHMDHIVDIPFLIDAFFAFRNAPLNIYGLPHTLRSLKRFILNWDIWPDFNEIELLNRSNKSILLHEIDFDKIYEIDGLKIKPIRTVHTVPSCGYVVTKEDKKKIFFTSDTYKSDRIWDEVNSDLNIKALIIEVSFPSTYEKLAFDSKHLTPKLLENELKKLKRTNLDIYVNHMKPDFLEVIKSEFEKSDILKNVKLLDDGYVIKI